MKIGILGTGVFSVSIALVLSQKNENTIVMWSENKLLVESYQKNRKFTTFFKDKKMPKNIHLTNSYAKAVESMDLVFLLPSVSYLENVCMSIQKLIKKDVPICIGTKGIAPNGNLFVHEVARKYLKNPLLVFGGPTFAIDVANLEPVAFQVASKNKKSISLFKKAFLSTSIFPTFTDDFIGISLCGCVKNIYAIGAGIIHGLGYNESTLLFYLTCVYQELEMLLFRFHSTIITLHGFSGFGDLVLTCTSFKSRNHSFGEILGKSTSIKEKEKYLNENTVEGVHTLEALVAILKKKRVEAPIINVIYKIVYQNDDPKNLLQL